MTIQQNKIKNQAIIKFISLSESKKGVKIGSNGFNKSDYNKKKYLTRSEKYTRSACLHIAMSM